MKNHQFGEEINAVLRATSELFRDNPMNFGSVRHRLWLLLHEVIEALETGYTDDLAAEAEKLALAIESETVTSSPDMQPTAANAECAP